MSFSPSRPSPEQLALWDDGLLTELRLAGARGAHGRPIDGVLPTGSLILDAMLGIGGFPRGRLVEIFGPPGAGKSTVALQFLGAAQAAGQTVALIDTEHSFEPSYARALGLDPERLVLVRPANGDEALRIADHLTSSQAVDAIVLDSVAALVPPDELTQPIDELADPYAHGELVASGLRRISRSLVRSPACVIFLNQLRAYHGFGYTETSTGGWGLKLHAAIRMELRGLDPAPAGGHRAAVRVIKNQFFRATRGELVFTPCGRVSPEAEAVRLGLRFGLVTRSPEQGLLFGGAPLEEGPEHAAPLVAAVREHIGEVARRGAGRANSASRTLPRPADIRSALPG